MSLPGPFTPNDTLIGPIVHELARRLKAEVPGIQHVYEEAPDKAPENLSLLLPLVKFKVEGDTNGKLYLCLTFAITLMIRRTTMSRDVSLAYAYLPSFLDCLSAWETQSLTDTSNVDHAITVSPGEGGVSQRQQGQEQHLALVVMTDVRTEYNVATS